MIKTAALITGLTLASSAYAAPVVTNGNFEANNGTPIVGFSGGSDIAAITGAQYIPCCGTSGTVAELANSFASFGSGNVANISTLTQTVAGTKNGNFKLNFDFGALGQGNQTLNVFVNGSNVGSYTATANNALGSTFSPYSLTFAGNGTAPATIGFSVDAATNNVDGVLDNVSVSGVPEASTWAMMIGGLGVAGGALRHRRSKANVRFA